MHKLTLEDVEKARANTPVDYYRKDVDTLDTQAYQAFVNGASFTPGVAFADDKIIVQTTQYTRRGRTKRRYQIHVFLNDELDHKLDSLCLYIPVWAFFKIESFTVQSIDQTSTEGSDTFSIHAIQGSKHVRIASTWQIEKNVCTIHTEWFTARLTFNPHSKAASFDYYRADKETGGHLMSKDRQRLRTGVKGKRLVRSQLSFTPDVKAALEQAAKAEKTSASLIVNEILESHPRVAEYLDPDSEL